jgi:hypothetical protein
MEMNDTNSHFYINPVKVQGFLWYVDGGKKRTAQQNSWLL